MALSSGEKGGDRLSAQTVTSAAREDGAISTDRATHPRAVPSMHPETKQGPPTEKDKDGILYGFPSDVRGPYSS